MERQHEHRWQSKGTVYARKDYRTVTWLARPHAFISCASSRHGRSSVLTAPGTSVAPIIERRPVHRVGRYALMPSHSRITYSRSYRKHRSLRDCRLFELLKSRREEDLFSPGENTKNTLLAATLPKSRDSIT